MDVDTAAAGAAAGPVDIVEQSKSESDQKKYKLLTLPNALQVLLISTKDVTRRAGDDDSDDSGDDDDSKDDDDSEDGDSDDSMGEDGGQSDDDEYDEEEGEEERGGASRRAGACLTIGVGSYAEPANLPGLAHYLEHMVFMGTCLLYIDTLYRQVALHVCVIAD